MDTRFLQVSLFLVAEHKIKLYNLSPFSLSAAIKVDKSVFLSAVQHNERLADIKKVVHEIIWSTQFLMSEACSCYSRTAKVLYVLYIYFPFRRVLFMSLC